MPTRIHVPEGQPVPDGVFDARYPGMYGNHFRISDNSYDQWSVYDYHQFGARIMPGFTERGAAKFAVTAYEQWFGEVNSFESAVVAVLHSLYDQDVACSCPLTFADGSRYPCHADWLMAQAEQRRDIYQAVAAAHQ